MPCACLSQPFGWSAGKWKGTTVAVKIIEHSAESSSGIKELRESVLSSSIIHPNVVSTYKIRTIPAACPKSCQAYPEVHPPPPLASHPPIELQTRALSVCCTSMGFSVRAVPEMCNPKKHK